MVENKTAKKDQSEKLETPFMTIWKEDGILHCVFNEGLDMDLPTAKYCVKTRIEFSGGKDYPCFINMKGLRKASKEARDYMGKEGAELIKAGALLTGNPLTKMFGNIFLTLNKPKVPTKLFSDETAALTWLKNYCSNEIE
ncbi:MAG: hypothetical protein HY064_02745 [Bacteroidetes bacterium]|nr:hypothetical protein [Bacteroidota bacterium]